MEQAKAALSAIAAIADPDCATRTELTFDPRWTLDHIAFQGRHEMGRSE